MAERNLDIFAAAVLRDRSIDRPHPTDTWRRKMDELASASCAEYRKVVREDPRFVPYFRKATPEMELAGLNVGSRPAKRNPKGGVESLRAIPWIFAWSQTRLNLPAWLGVEVALKPSTAADTELLRSMYKEWPWFKTTVSMVEMVLAKSEPQIAEQYATHAP